MEDWIRVEINSPYIVPQNNGRSLHRKSLITHSRYRTASNSQDARATPWYSAFVLDMATNSGANPRLSQWVPSRHQVYKSPILANPSPTLSIPLVSSFPSGRSLSWPRLLHFLLTSMPCCPTVTFCNQVLGNLSSIFPKKLKDPRLTIINPWVFEYVKSSKNENFQILEGFTSPTIPIGFENPQSCRFIHSH